MSLLVDYRCGACGAVTEEFVASPIPAMSICGTCGGPARRVYGGAGLLGVGLRKAAKDRLDRERAERTPSAGAGAGGSHDHDHHHHGHSPGHHDHDHDHGHDHGDQTRV